MRVGTDFPRRSRRYPGGLVGVLVTLALVVLAVFALRGIAVEATNRLWFGSVDLIGVWSKMMWTRIDLGLAFSGMFFVACWLSLAIAAHSEALPPPVIVVDPEQDPAESEQDVAARYRRSVAGRHPLAVRIITAVLLAVLVGAGASAEWNNWILFQHEVSFGAKDPLFHMNLGFFVFKLPFLSFLAGWTFVALLVLLVVSAVMLYLNGSIRLQGEGPRVSSQAKALLSVLMGLIALAKAGGYYLSRFGLDVSTRGYAEGAFFTDVHADLPALSLLILISLACSVIFVVNIRRPGWVLPAIGVGLWAFVAVVAGAIYPAIVQAFVVGPNQLHKEAPYISLNIGATRKAMGISNVVTRPFADNETLSAQSASTELSSLKDLSVWDPSFALASFKALDDVEPYFTFKSAGMDRYNLSGTLTPTIMAVRGLSGVGSDTWVNQHLLYTHGEGAVVAPANTATSTGEPDLVVSGLPPTSATGAPVIKQPEIYFGEGMPGYVVASTAQPELDYPASGGGNVESTYKGSGGVVAGGLVRRAAFALRFGSLDMLTSPLINPSSKVMFVRNVGARVKKAAPFLAYDANPYPVIVNGQIDWVIDAYTITDKYPYAQQADVSSLSSPGSGGSVSGLDTTFNYVRNSVTVVVNAYSGAMTFYVVDPRDPIVRAYEEAFPGLFTPGTSMPDALKAQLRYPQDLFSVQAAMLGRYHLTTVAGFYTASNVWSSALAPGTGLVTYAGSGKTTSGAGGGTAGFGGADPTGGASGAGSAAAGGGAGKAGSAAAGGGAGKAGSHGTTLPGVNTATSTVNSAGATEAQEAVPTYQVSQLPGDPSLTFNIMTPLVATSSTGTEGGLTGLLVARSTPGEDGNGQLEIFAMPTARTLAGPAQVSAQIHQNPAISTRIGELTSQGDTVLLGTVQAMPIGQSLLWVRSLYVSSGRALSPRLADVIVVYGSQSAMEPTFAGALAAVLGQAVPGLGPTGPTGPGSGTPPASSAVSSPVSALVNALIADADADLGTAQGELRQGDLSGYQADVEKALVLLGRAEQELSPSPTLPSTPVSQGPGAGAGLAPKATSAASGVIRKTASSIGSA